MNEFDSRVHEFMLREEFQLLVRRTARRTGLKDESQFRTVLYALYGTDDFMTLRDERVGSFEGDRRQLQARRGHATRAIVSEMEKALSTEGVDVLIARARAAGYRPPNPTTEEDEGPKPRATRCSKCSEWATYLHLDGTGVIGQHLPLCQEHAYQCRKAGGTVATPLISGEAPARDRVAPGWLTLASVAELLGIRQNQAAPLAAIGLLPAIMIAGRFYVRESSVRDLIAGQYLRGIGPRWPQP